MQPGFIVYRAALGIVVSNYDGRQECVAGYVYYTSYFLIILMLQIMQDVVQRMVTGFRGGKIYLFLQNVFVHQYLRHV